MTKKRTAIDEMIEQQVKNIEKSLPKPNLKIPTTAAEKETMEALNKATKQSLTDFTNLVPPIQFDKELRKSIDNLVKSSLPDFDVLFPPLELERETRKRLDKIISQKLPDIDSLSRNVIQGQVEIALKKAQSSGKLLEFQIPDVPVLVPKLPEHGDFAFPAMRLAKHAKMNPLNVAEIIMNNMPSSDFVNEMKVIPPGFLNFFRDSKYLAALEKRILLGWVDIILEDFDQLLPLYIGEAKKAQVEFVSANPTGPITIGHARGAVVGDTMARLLEASGFNVQREYYYNNAGHQLDMLGESLILRCMDDFGDEVDISVDYGDDHYQGEYLADIAGDLNEQYGIELSKKDLTFFKNVAESRMFDWINRSLASIDIKHDEFFNETSLFESGRIWRTLAAMRDNGHIYESTHWEGAEADEIADVAAKRYEPATWFRSSAFGDEKDRVMVKSDGAPTYTLPDIAYHSDKLERGFDIAVNVLGTDHFTQAQVVKYGLQALGLDPAPIHVIFVQMVRAVRWNEARGEYEAVKQSKRAGDFDTLDDLVEMTSADAVRYHMLARSPNSQLDFDVDQVVKQSNENPVYYIQNAYVRCAGIFREAEERGVSDEGAQLNLLGADELRFVRKALELGNVIEQAALNYEPHKIAFYAQELAAVFHPIYDRARVLHSEVPPEIAKARLRFYRAAAVVFLRVLRLMGMSAPERM